MAKITLTIEDIGQDEISISYEYDVEDLDFSKINPDDTEAVKLTKEFLLAIENSKDSFETVEHIKHEDRH